MSDNLPFEIQMEIMKRVPVKSLILLRSVSKTWKSLIDSTRFISDYSYQASHLFVSHVEGPVFLTFADDENTFLQNEVSLTTPSMIDHYSTTIGCSHGLICSYTGYHYLNAGRGYTRISIAYLWNPSIRKVVAVSVPNMMGGGLRDGDVYKTVLGFGVCRETVDPKIVKINYITKESDIETITSIPWQVEVFALSTGVWTSVYYNLPRKSIAFTHQHEQAVVDGFIYWVGTDRVKETYNLIISFDVTSEEFGEVYLPDCLARKASYSLSVSKLRESLVVLEQGVEANNLNFVVWMMEDGVRRSFTKLFSGNVNTPEHGSILGFRNNGEAIIEMREDYDGKLVVYEPSSKRINNLGLDGFRYSFYVCSYKETLLLLDHPYLSVYNGKKTHEFEDDLSPEQFQLLFKM